MAMFLWNIAFSQFDDTAELRPFVTTGNIRPVKRAESVHNTKLIPREVIERLGAVNLSDVLSKEMNIRLTNDNILGSSMSIQGISGQNIKILLDGIPITGRENGNIDLSQLNMNNIERIEIIEGPLSVIYGSDALGGVINLISKNILLDSSKPVIGFGNAYVESIRQYNFGGGAIFKVQDANFSASLNRNFFGGFAPDKTSRVMFWKPKQQVFGNFSILYQNKKLKVRFKTDIFNEKIENRGTPVINHLEAYAYDEYYLTNRNITSANVDYKLRRGEYLTMLSSFGFYQRDKVTYRKDLTQQYNNMQVVPSPDANSTNSFLNFMSRGSYDNTRNVFFAYQFGYDLNFNSAFGTKIEADKGRMNDYAVYGCAEWRPFKELSIKPGFRATYNTRYSAPFIPSVQLKYSKNAYTFRFAYGRGFRAPSLKELYLYFVDYNHNIKGNPDLKSELSDNLSATFTYEKKYSKDRFVIVTNNYFMNMIYNQIALVATNPIALEYTYGNIDNFRSIGTNVNIEMSYSQFKIVTGASYTGYYNNAFEMIGEKKYLYSPELRNQLSYKFYRKNHKTDKTPYILSVFHKYNGKTFGYILSDTRSIVTRYTQAYHMLDVTVNKSLVNKKISLTFGCKNLLDVTNIISTGSSNSFHSAGGNTAPVSIGRSFFTQVNFKF